MGGAPDDSHSSLRYNSTYTVYYTHLVLIIIYNVCVSLHFTFSQASAYMYVVRVVARKNPQGCTIITINFSGSLL